MLTSNKGTPPIILIIGLINLLVFCLLALLNGSFAKFSTQSVYWLGANYAPWIEQGQIWRLLTSLFLHFGPLHLAFNCIALLYLGQVLLPLTGQRLFLLAYLMTGVSSSYTSFLFNKDVVSAGASGAIFGLFGFFVALLFSNLLPRPVRTKWLQTIAFIVAINLGLGLFLPVDNAAHIGGLVSGLVLGLILLPYLINRRSR